MFSECMSKCADCHASFVGNCLAGSGDDDYTQITQSEAVELLERNVIRPNKIGDLYVLFPKLESVMEKRLKENPTLEQDTFDVDTIRHMAKCAVESKIKPLRYASTKVVTIKWGILKGMKTVPKGTPQRKNGKFRCYEINSMAGGCHAEAIVV